MKILTKKLVDSFCFFEKEAGAKSYISLNESKWGNGEIPFYVSIVDVDKLPAELNNNPKVFNFTSVKEAKRFFAEIVGVLDKFMGSEDECEHDGYTRCRKCGILLMRVE